MRLAQKIRGKGEGDWESNTEIIWETCGSGVWFSFWQPAFSWALEDMWGSMCCRVGWSMHIAWEEVCVWERQGEIPKRLEESSVDPGCPSVNVPASTLSKPSDSLVGKAWLAPTSEPPELRTIEVYFGIRLNWRFRKCGIRWRKIIHVVSFKQPTLLVHLGSWKSVETSSAVWNKN